MVKCYGKKGGGIVGIIRIFFVFSRWYFFYNLRLYIGYFIRNMYDVNLDDIFIYNKDLGVFNVLL